MRKFLKGFALTAAMLCLGAGSAQAATETVTTPTGEWSTGDTRPPGTGTFEPGPATPPLGSGSFELNTPDSTAKVQLLTSRYDGTALADIDGLSYSTYRDPASTGFEAGVAALNIRVDLDGDGNPDAYMVYEPYQDHDNAAVQTGVWQDWDAYAGGSAEWWINTNAAGCGQATPCEWSQIVAAYPNATIEEGANCGPGGITVPCPGSLGVNQGSGNPGIISNVDALTVSVGGDETTFDFEPAISPLSKDDCKKGGWQNMNAPAFKNQGDCVSYVATGGRN